jgi:hypothetical protein
LDQRLRAQLAVHRSTALPRYADFAERLQTRLQQTELTVTEIQQFENESRQLYVDLMTQLIDDSVELIAGLNDEQVQHLQKRLQEEREENAEQYAQQTPEERLAERIEQVTEDLESLTGRLSKAQREVVKQAVMQRNDLYPLGQATRERWSQKINQGLLERKNKAYLKSELLVLLTQSEQLRDEAYQLALDRNESLRRQLYVDLFATLSVKQRQHLVDEINDWHDDFVALMQVNPE